MKSLGQDDQTIPIDWGRFTASNLALYCPNLDIQFYEYPECDHEISEEQVILNIF